MTFLFLSFQMFTIYLNGTSSRLKVMAERANMTSCSPFASDITIIGSGYNSSCFV